MDAAVSPHSHSPAPPPSGVPGIMKVVQGSLRSVRFMFPCVVKQQKKITGAKAERKAISPDVCVNHPSIRWWLGWRRLPAYCIRHLRMDADQSPGFTP